MDLLMTNNKYVLSKLTTQTVLIYFLGSIISAYLAYFMINQVMLEQNKNKLEAILNTRATAVEDYYQLNQKQVIYLAQNEMIIRATHEFTLGYINLSKDLDIQITEDTSQYKDLLDYYQNEFASRLSDKDKENLNLEQLLPRSNNGRLAQWAYIVQNPNQVSFKSKMASSQYQSRYNVAHREYHIKLSDFMQAFGFYDVFLLDLEGQLLYSVFKEIDFGTNFLDGPHGSSSLGQAFRGALASGPQQVTTTDFSNYAPSYFKPGSFLASPIFDNGTKIGVVAFQIDTAKLNTAVSNLHGLGDSGETYVVGPDWLMRSDSRFFDSSTILRQKVETTSAKNAIRGRSGSTIDIDYRNVSVLSLYKPLKIAGLNWGIIAEVDEQEIMAPAMRLVGYTIGIFTITLIIIAFVSLSTLRLCVIRPLQQLLIATEQFRQGNYAARAQIISHDEFAILGESHNKMAEAIESHVTELEYALADVKELSGLLPICASCKSIRDDDGYFKTVETYLIGRSQLQFSHTICQVCIPLLYPELSKELSTPDQIENKISSNSYED